jgi:DNA-binding beta-propeller fold protein YncE
MTTLVAFAALLASAIPAFSQEYELWVVDQSNVEVGGDRLYVYQAPNWAEPAEVIVLSERAAGVGDGAGLRPHLLMFNNSGSHALLANVATGHVYVIRGSDKSIVGSVDVGEQAHGAIASPDDRWILAANQNGKKLARIRADFGAEQFSHDVAGDLDLGALQDEQHPDNAPICPVMYVGSSKAYVTLRGGGLFVVDTAATPMRVTRQYGKEQIAAAGCGGLVQGDKVWINSGAANNSDLYLFDANTDDLLLSISVTPWGTDAHGMLLIGDRYLWMANRGAGDNIVILDTQSNEIIGSIPNPGIAPDLMDISPDGEHVFLTLRGPKALTGGMPAIGDTPGIAVIAVEQGGAAGRRVSFLPIGAQGPESPADPHGIAVRKSSAVMVAP